MLDVQAIVESEAQRIMRSALGKVTELEDARQEAWLHAVVGVRRLTAEVENHGGFIRTYVRRNTTQQLLAQARLGMGRARTVSADFARILHERCTAQSFEPWHGPNLEEEARIAGRDTWVMLERAVARLAPGVHYGWFGASHLLDRARGLAGPIAHRATELGVPPRAALKAVQQMMRVLSKDDAVRLVYREYFGKEAP